MCADLKPDWAGTTGMEPVAHIGDNYVIVLCAARELPVASGA